MTSKYSAEAQGTYALDRMELPKKVSINQTIMINNNNNWNSIIYITVCDGSDTQSALPRNQSIRREGHTSIKTKPTHN